MRNASRSKTEKKSPPKPQQQGVLFMQQEPLRLGFLIHDVSRLRKTLLDQRLKEVGITRSQWWVLANLSRHQDQPVSQVELAQLIDMKKVTLGGLVDRMEAAQFVTRIDPRRIDVSIISKYRKRAATH